MAYMIKDKNVEKQIDDYHRSFQNMGMKKIKKIDVIRMILNMQIKNDKRKMKKFLK